MQAGGSFVSRRENLQRGPFTFPHLPGLEGEHEVYQGSLWPVNPAGESGLFVFSCVEWARARPFMENGNLRKTRKITEKRNQGYLLQDETRITQRNF